MYQALVNDVEVVMQAMSCVLNSLIYFMKMYL